MRELFPLLVVFAVCVIFLASPIIALICGIVRVSKYNDAKLQRVMKPDSYTDEDMKYIKKSIIAAFVTALILAVVVILVVLLYGQEIVYM